VWLLHLLNDHFVKMDLTVLLVCDVCADIMEGLGALEGEEVLAEDSGSNEEVQSFP
jgi:hypothetical protein